MILMMHVLIKLRYIHNEVLTNFQMYDIYISVVILMQVNCSADISSEL